MDNLGQRGDECAVGQQAAVLTRRRFLCCAGLAAGAALAGGVRPGRLLAADRRSAVKPSKASAFEAASLSGATIREYTMESRTVPSPVHYAVAWPPGTWPGMPLPVCYALSGYGDGPPVRFAAAVAKAVSAGAVAPYSVVAVGGGISFWHPRRSGEDRLAMLFDELIPLCTDVFRLGGVGGRRAIIGWSMGGYGALLAAETQPQYFSAVVAVSPAVWPSYAAMKRAPVRAFDDPADFAAHDVMAHADRLAGTNLRLECGTSDRFYGNVRILESVLPEPPSGGYGPGGHGEKYWRRVAPADAEFVGRALG